MFMNLLVDLHLQVHNYSSHFLKIFKYETTDKFDIIHEKHEIFIIVIFIFFVYKFSIIISTIK